MSRSLNVVLVRPEEAPGGGAGGMEAAAGALRRAAGISAPYVLVAADPLSAVAGAWQAMWDITAEARGSDEFELRAAEAMAAWRARRFELPDYYLVLAEEAAPGRGEAPATAGGPAAGAAAGPGEPRPDFYLGPLRAVRPNRVAVAAGPRPPRRRTPCLARSARCGTGRGGRRSTRCSARHEASTPARSRSPRRPGGPACSASRPTRRAWRFSAGARSRSEAVPVTWARKVRPAAKTRLRSLAVIRNEGQPLGRASASCCYLTGSPVNGEIPLIREVPHRPRVRNFPDKQRFPVNGRLGRLAAAPV